MRKPKVEADHETYWRRLFRRATLAAVLYADDLAVVLKIPEEEADRLLRAGELGPVVMINGRPAILREVLLSHLRRASTLPGTVSGPWA